MPQQISTNTFGSAKWIVSPDASQGTHTTIGTAITSASSGDTIFIRPGTYTENLTLKAGVNLTAYECDSGGSINFGSDTPHVTVIGKATATFVGTATLSGIFFQTNSDFVLVVSGASATTVSFKNCFFNGSNNSLISGTSSAGFIDLLDCTGNLATTGINHFAVTSGCAMNIQYCQFYNSGGSSTANTLANACSVNLIYSTIDGVITISDTSTLSCLYSSINFANSTLITLSGTSVLLCDFCDLESGTASAISIGTGCTATLNTCAIASTNAHAITGAGTLDYSAIDFTSSSSNINTSTINLLENALGTITRGIWNGSPITVPYGGTGAATLSGLLTGNGTSAITGTAITQYNVITAGASNVPNSVAPSATSGVPLISQGAASQPIFGTVAIAGGGTNATSFTQSNGIVAYNGTSLVNYAGPQLSSGGVQTNTSQPCFSVYLSATTGSVTGDGTAYTVLFDTILANVGSGYNTGTGFFTAPRTGKYLFTYTVCYGGLTAASLIINAFNGSVYSYRSDQVGSIGASGTYISSGSTILPMTAGDTMSIIASAFGGTKSVQIDGSALTSEATSSVFSGYLLC